MIEKIPDSVIQWITQSVFKHAEIHSYQPLKGGTSSSIFQVCLNMNGIKKEVIVRLFDHEEWLKEEPDVAIHESESLKQAEIIEMNSPRLIAVDPTGTNAKIPAIIMSKINGEVILNPKNMRDWINGLAEVLAKIHRTNADDFPWVYAPYQDLLHFSIPEWSERKEEWEVCLAYLKEASPEIKYCFIHRDFHPANVLWEENKVSGVVDWPNACRGPQGVDVGHCRVNLAMLHGVEVSKIFLEVYQEKVPDFSYNPYWDLVSLVDILFGPPKVFEGWKALGITYLTDEIIMKRLDDYLLSLLNKL